MRHRRKITALLLFGGLVLMTFALAQPASAEVIQGPCIGDAVFSNGTVVTERTPLSVNNAVPAEDTVEYFGDTTLSDPAEPESFSGNVSVRLPAGGSWVVVDWPDGRTIVGHCSHGRRPSSCGQSRCSRAASCQS